MSENELPEISKRGPGNPNWTKRDRPELRSDQRQEVREAVREQPRLQRRFKATQDKFHIPQSIVDAFKGMGLEAEWKRHSVGGKEESYYAAELAMNYWEPLLIEQYPHLAESLAPLGQKSGPIIKSDQILMIRPDYLCEDARQEQRAQTDRLMQANRSKMKEAPAGTFDRLVDDRRVGPAIRKSHEPLSADV